ncbi:MAG: type II secretion system protein [Verrucomicrobiaceae bacterium]|nr:MAG: type II secretion system protein [Verrucomicrobiaceae bacterium]
MNGRNLLSRNQGFTLIEISMVIGLILTLTAIAGLSISSVTRWKNGRNASLALQAVYAAQRGYLADHPTSTLQGIPSATLTSYLPTGWSGMPTMTGLNGEVLTLDYISMPPVFLNGANRYDPSPGTSDGLWDVGE